MVLNIATVVVCPARTIRGRCHPFISRSGQTGAESQTSLWHITEVYLVRDHPPAQLATIAHAAIGAGPLKAPSRRHRGQLNRRNCCELHQGEPIPFDIWWEDTTAYASFS